jgi:hypothetical protein
LSPRRGGSGSPGGGDNGAGAEARGRPPPPVVKNACNQNFSACFGVYLRLYKQIGVTTIMKKKNKTSVTAPEFSLIDENFLKSRIYTIRGIKVMLDADLAEIYGYTTKAFNQQVKNNIEKFAEDFRFQLNNNELAELSRSKKIDLDTGESLKNR